jgi:hypothetical protein
MPNFPSALDALSNPTATTRRNDLGYELHAVISTLNDIVEALETKLGISASVPAANTVLRGTGAGSTAFGQLQAGDLVPGTSTMLKIGEVVGTGASGVMEIASIPSTYRSLVLEWVGRSTAAATIDDARLTFETTPTAANYAHQYMYASNTAFTAAQASGTLGYIPCGFLPAASSTATLTAGGRIELPEYANAAAYKTTISHNAGFTNLAGAVYYAQYSVGLWTTLPAINRLRLILGSGSWTTASRMTLWGLPA